ncbi:single-stranded DNA-binding protein [Patescibacteria group bacterium]|nr:single-stranded DNA-binding protein [Patescibacteria group bacterium]
MRSVNKVILVGNLTRDPELKSTTSGQSIVTFGLATNRQWVTSNGERKDSAEFHECVAWARLAEICQKYLKKGMLVYVEGYLKTRSWDMEDGTRRFRTEVVLQDMIMLEKRGEGEYLPTGEDGYSVDEESHTEEPRMGSGSISDDGASDEPTTGDDSASDDQNKDEAGGLSANIEDDNMF